MSDAGKRSDYEAIDDQARLIAGGARAVLQGHCLNVIEAMASAARCLSTAHARAMLDDALVGIRHVLDALDLEDAQPKEPNERQP